MSDDVIGKLRQALAEFDRCGTTDRSGRVERARRVLTLVRELLSEVDGVRQAGGSQYHIDVDPLGPPDPAHGELPGDETHAFAPGSGPLPDSDPEACDVCGEGGGHWRHNVPDPSLD